RKEISQKASLKSSTWAITGQKNRTQLKSSYWIRPKIEPFPQMQAFSHFNLFLKFIILISRALASGNSADHMSDQGLSFCFSNPPLQYTKTSSPHSPLRNSLILRS